MIRPYSGVRDYTAGMSDYVNLYLENRLGPKDSSDIKLMSDIIEVIDDLDHLMEPTSNPMILYRGLGKKPKFVNGLLYQPNYISASLEMDMAINFAGDDGYILVIDVPAGTMAVDTIPYSNFPEELEIILARDLTLVLEDRPSQGLYNVTIQ